MKSMVVLLKAKFKFIIKDWVKHYFIKS